MARKLAARAGLVPLTAKLRVRLTPAAGADRIDGAATDENGKVYLKARVRAAPENGDANRALEALLAKALGKAKTNVSVVRGGASRLKTIEIAGVSAADIAALLQRHTEQP